ncbi:META domain-containing protein [Psychrobacter sp. B38]|uniref:META domain-containing protein n=1 Tax=Psychrobacter sp. B38 TaxID=3143538 RepID=UPI003210CD7D
MALSLKTLSVRVGILSSVLVASLALSACQDPVSLQEQDMGESAQESNDKLQSTLVAANNNAVPTDESATETLSAEQTMIANLSKYRWTLISATDNKAQPLSTLTADDTQIRLSFDQYQGQNTLNYSVGCNTISAVYQLQSAVLTIEDSMSTKMSCGKLDIVENSLINLMQGDNQITVMPGEVSQEDRPILTQLTNEGTTLVWEGSLTPQAKYHSKGDTVFWAIKDKMVPCKDSTSQRCLQVKPVTYNDQGVKSSEGEWTTFAGVIEGYQHNDAHSEVLRLQRYQLDSSAAIDDESTNALKEQYAYVLDAVIESSVTE